MVGSRTGLAAGSRTPFSIEPLAASEAALFLIEAGTTLLTRRGVLPSGVRQLLVGFTAAAVTFGVGKLIGVAVSGGAAIVASRFERIMLPG